MDQRATDPEFARLHPPAAPDRSVSPDMKVEQRWTSEQKRRALMWAQTALSAVGPGYSAQAVNGLVERACTAVGHVVCYRLSSTDHHNAARSMMIRLCEMIIALPEVETVEARLERLERWSEDIDKERGLEPALRKARNP